MDFKKISYNGKKYCICKYSYKDQQKKFVIDADDFDAINDISKSWHLMGSYIGCAKVKRDGSKTIYFVHKIIMADTIGKKKGYTIEHINGNIADNRKENLHLVTQFDKKKLKSLRNDCDDDVVDLPKEIKYEPDKKRFYIEIKQSGETVFMKKLTDDESISVDDKMAQAKKELFKIHKQNPELVDRTTHKKASPKSSSKLLKEFGEILGLATKIKKTVNKNVDEESDEEPVRRKAMPRKGLLKDSCLRDEPSRRLLRHDSSRNDELPHVSRKSSIAKNQTTRKTGQHPDENRTEQRKKVYNKSTYPSASKKSANCRTTYYGSKTSKPKEFVTRKNYSERCAYQ